MGLHNSDADGVARAVLIGLGHASRVGKDTCAQLLIEHHGYERVAFADALREFVLRTHPGVRSIVERIGWEEAKEAHPFVRKTLVEVGNGARHILGEDVWIKAAFRRIRSERTAFTDMRYPNEAAAIRETGGLLVKVTRPGVDPLPNVADQALADFDGWDAVIVNDGSLGDLQVQLDELLARSAA